tara:strand:+ start:93 stop:608 length:516 start_codon:yes stop_codon:yes gene_type:complete
MAWYDSVLQWADPYIEDAAEFLNYADEQANVDDFYTAGQQLKDDVSDVFGFIQQGAKAYGKMAGFNEKGKPNQVFKQATYANKRQVRSIDKLTKGGSQVYQAGQTSMNGGVGYDNPYMQSAMNSLMNNPSINSQMSNLMANFAVGTNLQQGRKTSTGSTTLKKKAKKTATA